MWVWVKGGRRGQKRQPRFGLCAYRLGDTRLWDRSLLKLGALLQLRREQTKLTPVEKHPATHQRAADIIGHVLGEHRAPSLVLSDGIRSLATLAAHAAVAGLDEILLEAQPPLMHHVAAQQLAVLAFRQHGSPRLLAHRHTVPRNHPMPAELAWQRLRRSAFWVGRRPPSADRARRQAHPTFADVAFAVVRWPAKVLGETHPAAQLEVGSKQPPARTVAHDNALDAVADLDATLGQVPLEHPRPLERLALELHAQAEQRAIDEHPESLRDSSRACSLRCRAL